MQAFLSFLQSRGRKPSTLKRYEYDLADFHRFIDVVLDGEEAAVTPGDITTYFHILVEERHYQLRTLKRIQTVLVRYFRFLRDTQRIASNPMAELPSNDSVWNVLQEEELITPKE
ncbi:phage integrase N-terminal SAM-like domain-containing protein [Marinococcus halophilus]|uniref:phage integrase N-terminal SAM-like domain-containing protein n=1 Tax=Marinococcus halophilus TaxID=1371 RepID=UPI003606F20D